MGGGVRSAAAPPGNAVAITSPIPCAEGSAVMKWPSSSAGGPSASSAVGDGGERKRLCDCVCVTWNEDERHGTRNGRETMRERQKQVCVCARAHVRGKQHKRAIVEQCVRV